MTRFTQAPGPGQPRSVPSRTAQPGTAQPRALIVTIYGLYAREDRGWISVAALIRLMAELGADQPAVRSSISRLKQRGVLEPRREGGSAGYALSDHGRAILDEGDRRIFERSRGRLADGWLLAVFSVPEQDRRRRHELRSRLSWLGFGTVSAGVWIAPGHLAGETTEVLQRYQLSAYVDLFHADYLAFGAASELVGRWWDLGRLDGLYQAFLSSAEPVLARWPGGGGGARSGGDGGRPGAPDGGPGAPDGGPGATDGGTAFADYVRALTAWRRLPFLDPGLPAELLPADWPALRAASVFARLRERLAEPARAHVHSVTGRPGATG